MSCADRNHSQPVQAGPGVSMPASVMPSTQWATQSAASMLRSLRAAVSMLCQLQLKRAIDSSGKNSGTWKTRHHKPDQFMQRGRSCAVVELGEHLVPDEPGGRVDVAVDGRHHAFVVNAAAIRKSMMQFVLFHPPGRAETLRQRNEVKHIARLGVAAQAPLTMGDVMRDIAAARKIHGEHQRADDGQKTALRQKREGDDRGDDHFDDAKHLFQKRNIKVTQVARLRLQFRHALRKGSRIRSALRSDFGRRFYSKGQDFLPKRQNLTSFVWLAVEYGSAINVKSNLSRRLQSILADQRLRGEIRIMELFGKSVYNHASRLRGGQGD